MKKILSPGSTAFLCGILLILSLCSGCVSDNRKDSATILDAYVALPKITTAIDPVTGIPLPSVMWFVGEGVYARIPLSKDSNPFWFSQTTDTASIWNSNSKTRRTTIIFSCSDIVQFDKCLNNLSKILDQQKEQSK